MAVKYVYTKIFWSESDNPVADQTVKGTMQNQLQYTLRTNYQFIELNSPEIRLSSEFLSEGRIFYFCNENPFRVINAPSAAQRH